MSKKVDVIKDAVFYAHEKPEVLAEIIGGTITDVVTSISISGADSIEIPSGDTANTAKYSASVLSQFGDPMTAEVTFSLKSAVTGVSVSGDTVSVAKTATAESFTLVATASGKTAEKVVALATVNG